MESRQACYCLISASAPDAGTFQSLVEQLISSRRTVGLMVIICAAQRTQHLPTGVPTVLGARPSVEKLALVSLDDQGAAVLAVALFAMNDPMAAGAVAG